MVDKEIDVILTKIVGANAIEKKCYQMNNTIFKLDNPDIEASIKYITREEGGREGALHSGYRGHISYDGSLFSAAQEFLDVQICQPGDRIDVLIKFLIHESHIGKLYVGKRFQVREGHKIVGYGVVSKVFKEDLYINVLDWIKK